MLRFIAANIAYHLAVAVEGCFAHKLGQIILTYMLHLRKLGNRYFFSEIFDAVALNMIIAVIEVFVYIVIVVLIIQPAEIFDEQGNKAVYSAQISLAVSVCTSRKCGIGQ